MKIKKENKVAHKSGWCDLCHKHYEGFGNNAKPLSNGRCCDKCNEKVIVERLKNLGYKFADEK